MTPVEFRPQYLCTVWTTCLSRPSTRRRTRPGRDPNPARLSLSPTRLPPAAPPVEWGLPHRRVGAAAHPVTVLQPEGSRRTRTKPRRIAHLTGQNPPLNRAEPPTERCGSPH